MIKSIKKSKFEVVDSLFQCQLIQLIFENKSIISYIEFPRVIKDLKDSRCEIVTRSKKN